MIDPTTLADALLDPANDAAVRKAVEALAAWDAFPVCIRAAYGREARRLARRAAVAVVELLEVAAAAGRATKREGRGDDHSKTGRTQPTR